jgi:hypothetical protein
MTTNTIKLAGVAMLALLAATGGVTAAGADQVAPEPPQVAPLDNTPASAVQYAQARRFAELRRAREGDDAMPPTWERSVEDDTDADERWGANPDLSRLVAPGVWLIPGNGYVCVSMLNSRDGSLSLSCATAPEVEQGLLQPSDVDATGTGVVTGVMPDGVEQVTLVDSDGSARDFAVDRNVYRAAVDDQIKEVRWVDAAGLERMRPMAWTP